MYIDQVTFDPFHRIDQVGEIARFFCVAPRDVRSVTVDRGTARASSPPPRGGDLGEHRFMENVAVNRGYSLKVFNEIDAAHDWLIQAEPVT